MNRKSKRFLRNLTVLLVVLLGTLLALPTFFPVDPMLQVASEDGSPLAAADGAAVAAALDARIVPELEDGVVRLRFDSIDTQLRAKDRIAAALPDRVVAFNLRPRLPRWLEALGLKPVTLGLDLRGGVRFVYEMDLESVVRRLLEAELGAARSALREAGVREQSRISAGSVQVELRDARDGDAARAALGRGADLGAAAWLVRETQPPRHAFTLTPSDALLEAKRRASLQQNVATLRNRVNQLGVSEVVVQSQGADRILVEVPGVQDPAQLERILGSTATLEWRLDDMQHGAADAARRHSPPAGSVLRYDRAGTPLLLQRDVIASGEQLTDATFSYVEGRPAVLVRLDAAGAERMREATLHNVGKLLAVVYVEEKRVPAPSSNSEAEQADAQGGEHRYRTERAETVIFNGRIDNVLSDRFELRGLPPLEAQNLALLLRSGSLAAPIYKVESGAVSPTLGEGNIAKGRLAIAAGLGAVVVFMAAYYRVFGLIADLAVLANLVLVIGVLSLLPSALTLPGMAGLVLTAGMAVDANVLIFERIREELRKGRSPSASIEDGYAKAWATIIDSNLTTLIAGAVLFAFGTGPIKGFAVTLSLGIVTSMFTAVVGTRVLVDLIYGRAPRRLHIGGRIEAASPAPESHVAAARGPCEDRSDDRTSPENRL
ncbi:MAG TPA: protein translocase subunit SecD [Gammaproteobacteria bacterium]|nr:protein translocase subunit SecD [Gammaproteobacteria bacterium]